MWSHQWQDVIRKRAFKRFFSVVFFATLLVAGGISAPVYAEVGINEQIHYQGTLKDSSGNNVADGTYDMVFRLYDVSSGGTTLWTGTHTAANGNAVTVTDGVFSVLLGSGTGNSLASFDFNQDEIWLGITVSTDSEMTPRVRVGATAQAFLSERVVGTLTSAIGTTSPADNAVLTVEATSTSAIAAVIRGFTNQVSDLFRIISDAGTQLLTFTAGGNLGIGTSTPSATLSVAGNSLFSATSTFEGGLVVTGQTTLANATSTSFYTSTFGVGSEYFTNLTGTGLTITGNALTVSTSTFNLDPSSIDLTQGYILVGDPSGNAQATSSIFVNTSNGNVGIGTTTPGSLLTVVGTSTFAGDVLPDVDNIRNLGSASLRWKELFVGPGTIHLGTEANFGSFGYSTTSDYLIFDPDGDSTHEIVFTDSGHVGIGTTSPEQHLTVSGDGTQRMLVQSNTGQAGIEIRGSSGNGQMLYQPTGSNDLRIWSSQDTITFTDDGKVGIGTSTPESGLHIQHSDALGTQVYLQPKDANDRAIVGFYENDGNPLYTVGAREDSGTLFFSSGNLDPTSDTAPTLALLSNGNVGIGNTNILARFAVHASGTADILNLFESSGAEVFTVLESGNVGIGTTSPYTKLSVAGETVASHFTATSTATSTFPTLSVTGRLYDVNGTGGSSGEVLQSTGSGVDWVATSTLGLGNGTFLGLNDTISSYTINRVLFQSGSGVTDSSNLIFDGTNLGVGTSSPSAMFAVAGAGYFGGNLIATGTLDVTATTTLANDLRVDTDTFFVDSANNRVGIGTTAPSTALEITGSASVSVSGDALYINPAFDDGVYINLGGVRGIGVFQNGPLFMGYNTNYDPVSNSYEYAVTNEAALIEWTTAGDINFATKASGSAGTEYTADSRMIIKNDGKVGIGSSTPTELLSVEGNILATGRLDGSNFINHETDTSVYIGIDAGTSTAVSSSNNTALGDTALNSIDGGDRNTAVGFSALSSLTSGSSNTAIGRTALQNLTTADENIAIGFSALNQLSTGAQNTAIGGGAMFSGTTGADNAAFGYNALFANTDGASNVAIGKLAGYFLQDGTTLATSPDQSVLIGADTEFETATDSNSIVIGYGAEGQGSNTAVLGNDSITNTFLKGNVSIGTTTTAASEVLRVQGSSQIQAFYGDTDGQGVFSAWYDDTQETRVLLGADGTGFASTEKKGVLGTWTNSDMTIFANQVERARFGTTTANALDVNGDLFVGTGTTGCVKDNDGTVLAGSCSSDERLKMNVLSASPVLERMGQLDFFTYQWNDTAQSLYGYGTEATQYGVIADQAEEVFPELVYEDEKGYKTFDYTRLTLYTAQSVKELYPKIQDIDVKTTRNTNKIDELEQKNIESEQRIKDLEALDETALFMGEVGVNDPSPDHIFTVDHNGDGVNVAYVNSSNAWTSGSADYAEYYYTADTDLASGEAVCIDTTRENAVERCTRAADINLMGIISTSPAFLGNAPSEERRDEDPNYVIVGMLGQVPAQVTNENGAITPGDSLTSATQPGYIMKANVGDPTVGVALEALDETIGTINVLISRKNKSLTVETVEQEVTERIADMQIEDDVELMVTEAVSTLNLDADILSIVDRELAQLDIETTIAKQVTTTFKDLGLVLDIEEIGATSTATEESTDQPGWVITVLNAVFGRLTNFGIQIAEGVASFASIVTENLTAKNITTEEFCLSDEEGASCYTRAQLDAVLREGVVTLDTNDSELNSESISPSVSIIIHGNNPAELEVGATYGDLGASASSTDQTLVSLGVRTYFNEAEDSTPYIDTTIPGEYQIIYRILDGNNTVLAEATRIVRVVNEVYEEDAQGSQTGTQVDTSEETITNTLENTPETEQTSEELEQQEIPEKAIEPTELIEEEIPETDEVPQEDPVEETSTENTEAIEERTDVLQAKEIPHQDEI